MPYQQRRLFLITDENVYFHYKNHLKDTLKDFTVDYTIIQAGEASKTLDNYMKIAQSLLSKHIQRKDIIIAFGGGVVGDLAGFIAATILRGVDFIQVPTTLLAMVDSSIGSKVGVDTIHGKNLMGAFKHPLSVIIDPMYLNTLPEKEYQNGMAEVIKACFIQDASLFEAIQHNDTLTLIKKAIQVKKDIVQIDPFERHERMFLNFGHTFAHAIEVYSNYQIPHGYAVAMGMDIAIRLGIYFNITNKTLLDKLHQLYSYYQLPKYAGNLQELVPFLNQDKKSIGDRINFIFIEAIGKPIIKPIDKEVFYDIPSF